MRFSTDEIIEERAIDSKTQERPAGVLTRPSGRRLFTSAVLTAIALGLGFGFWLLSRQLAPELISPSAISAPAAMLTLPDKSIGVLPFQNLSTNQENAFLAEGVQDDILTALSKVADLRVTSRTSVNTYAAGVPRNLRQIAQTLGVVYLLEGTVRLVDDKVRITAQLIDVRRDTQLWTETYERELAGVFAIQSEIVQQVLSRLLANVSEKEKTALEERPTKDLAAYGLYVRAKVLIDTSSLNPRITEKLNEAAELLDQAIARDPDFFLAYIQLAGTHDYLYFFGVDRTPNRLALAEKALNTIIRMRPDAGEAHLAQANFLYRCYLDYGRARDELALAQRALPNNSEIYELMGYIDRRQGLWNESARSLQRALALDPRNFFILQQIALSYQEFRQFGAMAAAFDRALALIPRDFDTRLTRSLVDLEWKANAKPLRDMIYTSLAEDSSTAPDLAAQWWYLALCERDQPGATKSLAAIPPSGTSIDLNFPHTWCEGVVARLKGDEPAAQRAFLSARTELEKTVKEQPNYGPAFCVLGLIDAALGRKEEAIQEGRHAIEILPITKDAIDGAELVKYLAVIYAWTGEKDLAIQQVLATLQIPSTLSYGNLKLHPYWDSLRGDPRFEKIVDDLAPKNPAK